MREDWLDILRRVKAGELSVEAASRYLEDLDLRNQQVGEPAELPERSSAFVEGTTDGETWQPAPIVEDIQPELGWWKEAWLIPFGVGTGILVLSAILMRWAYSSNHFFWFYCSWLPLLLGLLALFLGWWSRQARWLHVRVQDAGGRRVSISMPLPLRFAGWALRTFGHFIPQMQDVDLTDMPVIFSSLEEAEGPMTVEVDDGGDRVRVYIL